MDALVEIQLFTKNVHFTESVLSGLQCHLFENNDGAHEPCGTTRTGHSLRAEMPPSSCERQVGFPTQRHPKHPRRPETSLKRLTHEKQNVDLFAMSFRFLSPVFGAIRVPLFSPAFYAFENGVSFGLWTRMQRHCVTWAMPVSAKLFQEVKTRSTDRCIRQGRNESISVTRTWEIRPSQQNSSSHWRIVMHSLKSQFAKKQLPRWLQSVRLPKLRVNSKSGGSVSASWK